MKLPLLYSVPITIFVLIGILAFGIQSLESKPLEKSDIYSTLSDEESFTRETSLLLTLYTQNKITSTYLINQLDQIDNKMLSVFDTLRGKKIESNDKTNLKKITQISTDYLFMTKSVEKKTEEKKGIDAEIKTSENLTKQIVSLEKKYE